MRLPAVATEASLLSFNGLLTGSSANARTHFGRENSVHVMDFHVKGPLVQLVSAGTSGKELQQQCSVRETAEGTYPG